MIAELWRELDVRSRARRTEKALARAGKTGEQLLLGPWVGEIGHELQYWIPFLRRTLGRHGIAPEQATVLTRGGAALWYRDFAASELDALELLTPEEFHSRFEQRLTKTRDLKQLRVESFERELMARARERLGDVTVVHPTLMFTRLRGLWFKNTPLDELWPLLEFRSLEVEPLDGLPPEYVAVKLYFNECLRPGVEAESFLRRSVERLAEMIDVVLLSTGLVVDDHEEWVSDHPRLHRVEHRFRPEDNLAVQTRIVAGARGLVSTYGGFSYLGPMLGVPALGVYELEQTVPLHLEVLWRSFPDADYARVQIGDDAAVERFASRVRAVGGA